jgi:hypothetical protein
LRAPASRHAADAGSVAACGGVNAGPSVRNIRTTSHHA